MFVHCLHRTYRDYIIERAFEYEVSSNIPANFPCYTHYRQVTILAQNESHISSTVVQSAVGNVTSHWVLRSTYTYYKRLSFGHSGHSRMPHAWPFTVLSDPVDAWTKMSSLFIPVL